jgi:hypothetical protein
MNRRERRKMSHNLGIMQYQQTLPLNKKFELIRENIIAGKQQHKEFTDEVKRLQSMTQEERDSENIQILAEQIAKHKKIAVLDALEEAQKTYYKGQKK